LKFVFQTYTLVTAQSNIILSRATCQSIFVEIVSTEKLHCNPSKNCPYFNPAWCTSWETILVNSVIRFCW